MTKVEKSQITLCYCRYYNHLNHILSLEVFSQPSRLNEEDISKMISRFKTRREKRGLYKVLIASASWAQQANEHVRPLNSKNDHDDDHGERQTYISFLERSRGFRGRATTLFPCILVFDKCCFNSLGWENVAVHLFPWTFLRSHLKGFSASEGGVPVALVVIS